MSDTPTPRVGEQIVYLLDDTMNEVEAVPAEFACQLERELAAERALPANLLDVHAICDQRDKALEDLHRERALADRLAGEIEEWLGSGYTLTALAAWKEARRDP